MPWRSSRVGAVVALALCSSGCSDPLTCAAIALSGVSINVVDSITLAAVSADSVTAKVVEEAYVDSVRVSSSEAVGGLGFASERVGTYTAMVTADGYHSWAVGDIQVTQGVCNVRPVELVARMRGL
jgi:hypothetical protein